MASRRTNSDAIPNSGCAFVIDRHKALALHRVNALRELRGALHGAAILATGVTPHGAVARRTPYMLGVFGWEYVDHVAAYTEGAAPEIELAPLVLHRHQPRQNVALRHPLSVPKVKDHAVVLRRVADAVDR